MKQLLYYDHVTVLDYAVFTKDYGPIGDSLIVNVALEGTTNSEGVVFDFSYAKKKVKEIIDQEVDHRFVVPRSLLKESSGRLHFKAKFGANSTLEYRAPKEAFCAIDSEMIDIEVLTPYLEKIVKAKMPDNVISVSIDLVPEINATNSGYFRYTHGLKKHYGNCQRLIHGHRSTLKIFHDKERRNDIESLVFARYFSKALFFVSLSDVAELKGGKLEEGFNINVDSISVKYESAQGLFEATYTHVPVMLMREETTVENISKFVAELIRKEFDLVGEFEFIISEGVGKGSKTILQPCCMIKR